MLNLFLQSTRSKQDISESASSKANWMDAETECEWSTDCVRPVGFRSVAAHRSRRFKFPGTVGINPNTTMFYYKMFFYYKRVYEVHCSSWFFPYYQDYIGLASIPQNREEAFRSSLSLDCRCSYEGGDIGNGWVLLRSTYLHGVFFVLFYSCFNFSKQTFINIIYLCIHLG